MDITFLIGNGFDINIGLNTRYKNFYDFYCLQKSSCKDLASLKKEIRNWSDLEVELGKYLGKINDEKKALLIYGDILEKLHSFIEAEENKHPITDINKNVILEDLLHPEKYVRLMERTEIRNAWLMHSEDWDIKIITFNYTLSLEKLIGYRNNRILIKRENGLERSVSAIEHIHGYTTERMVFGVNDVSQIENPDLAKSSKIVRRFVKSENNRTYGLGHERECAKWIDSSRLICLYGLSLGVTDKIWWQRIGNRLKTMNCILIIFYYDGFMQQDGNWGPDYEDNVEHVKNLFLSQLTLTEPERKLIRDKIFVSCNKNIFNVSVNRNDKERNHSIFR